MSELILGCCPACSAIKISEDGSDPFARVREKIEARERVAFLTGWYEAVERRAPELVFSSVAARGAFDEWKASKENKS